MLRQHSGLLSFAALCVKTESEIAAARMDEVVKTKVRSDLNFRLRCHFLLDFRVKVHVCLGSINFDDQ